MDQTSFVEKLVNCMNMQDIEICMADGNTAFCLAAISGNVKIAEILFGKNPKLLCMRGHNDMLPIQLASSAGHIPMTEFLFQATDDLHNILPFPDIVKLFFMTITNNIFSKLIFTFLYTVTLSFDLYISLCEKSIGYEDTVSSLFKGMEEEKESLNSEQLPKAMFDAAKSGNIIILEFLFKYHPDLLFAIDATEQRSLLHIAILYRQETVYRLILSKGASKSFMTQLVDFEGNNVLHLAGIIIYCICCYEIKFSILMKQKVEKIVPASMKRMRNREGLTPKELFYESHKELHKESVSEVKDTANTLVVVATLVITLGITAVLALPIKDIESKDTPIFEKKTWYTIFFLSIASGTSLCAASMFCYSSVILPSSWEPKQESVISKQAKLMIGDVTLIASVGVMILAVASGSILIFDFISNWILYFIVGLNITVVLLHFAVDFERWNTGKRTLLSFFHVHPEKRALLSFFHVHPEKRAGFVWPI
uniref:PGG domain-containing protein n=1 Tax=Cajanus cajan TaxID=3821 RepID=A0A151S6G7_CAJCA|nr:hypothetical protein KK1_027827 [Cajanus cajan]